MNRPRNRQSSRQSLRRTIIKQGYLKKVPQSGLVAVVKKWQERWFVFGVNNFEPFLEYYDNEDSVFTSPPTNTISLATCRHVQREVMDARNQYMFTITTSERVLSLIAKDRAEMGRWCEVISSKLHEMGVIANQRSEFNVYEELPVKKTNNKVERQQRPLPLEPGTNNADDFDVHDYVNTSLPSTNPPPLPQRNISTTSTTSDFEDVNPQDLTNNDDEDPFEALAQSRTLPICTNGETSSQNINDETTPEHNDNYHQQLCLSNGIDVGDINFTTEAMQSSGVNINTNNSDNEEEYDQVWKQSSGATALHNQSASDTQKDNKMKSNKMGDTRMETKTKQFVDLEQNHENSQRKDNDYVDLPTPNIGGQSPQSLSRLPANQNPIRPPPRHLSFVTGRSCHDRNLPPLPEDSSNSPSTTQNDAVNTNTLVSPSQDYGNNIPPDFLSLQQNDLNRASNNDSVFLQKCAAVDATNPLLSAAASPPPYVNQTSVAASPRSPLMLSPSSPQGGDFPPEYTPTSRPITRGNRQSLSNMQQLGSRAERGRSLKQSQVELLKQEIKSQGGVFVSLKRRECHHVLCLVDMIGGVWVAGWNYKLTPYLHNAFHIGDQIISVNGHVVQSAHDANKIIKHSAELQKLSFNVRRVPYGRVLAVVRAVEGESLGIKRAGGTAEIVNVEPQGLAAQYGLPAKATTRDGNSLCNWVLTEVNMRPLNLFFKENEIEHRLNAVGRDISIMVQPHDFISALKKKLKLTKNYKDFLVQ